MTNDNIFSLPKIFHRRGLIVHDVLVLSRDSQDALAIVVVTAVFTKDCHSLPCGFTRTITTIRTSPVVVVMAVERQHSDRHGVVVVVVDDRWNHRSHDHNDHSQPSSLGRTVGAATTGTRSHAVGEAYHNNDGRIRGVLLHSCVEHTPTHDVVGGHGTRTMDPTSVTGLWYLGAGFYGDGLGSCGGGVESSAGYGGTRKSNPVRSRPIAPATRRNLARSTRLAMGIVSQSVED